jgi:hypothetical protein
LTAGIPYRRRQSELLTGYDVALRRADVEHLRRRQ